MTKESKFTLIDLALPYQRDFILAKKKRKLWLSSRQIGKSWSLAFIAVEKALQKNNGLSLCISTGGRAASELMKKVNQMAEAVKIITNGRIDYQASQDACKFSNGSRVLSLPSGNPTALRGWSAQAILIDECAFIERPYDVMAAIGPSLTRDPDSELIIASTPAGKQGLFWDIYNTVDEKWHVQTTTIEDAVKAGLNVDIDEIRQLCPDNELFEQEYMCRFAADFSSLIDPALLDFNDPDKKPVARWCGMDIGSRSDRTAIVTLAQLPDLTYFVEDVAILNKASYADQLQILKELHAKYNYVAGYIDQNGIGGPIAEFANKQVSAKIKGFTWTAANKTPAYEELRSKCFDHKMAFPTRLRDLVVRDFTNVNRVVSESGKVSYEAGRNGDGHSDFTSALVLAIQSAVDSPNQTGLPAPNPIRSVFSPHPLGFGGVRSRL